MKAEDDVEIFLIQQGHSVWVVGDTCLHLMFLYVYISFMYPYK